MEGHSIFKLKQDPDTDLDSSNHGITNSNLRQITASRGINKDSFSSGVQNFKFELAGNKWWRPSKSYMRLRCKLSKTAAVPLRLSDGIAPAMGLCGNLYQNMDFKMGDTTISRVSNNVGQVNVLKQRLEKSRAWTKSIGASTNFWDESFVNRQNAVCQDGVVAGRIVEETLRRQDQIGYNAADTAEYKANKVVEIVYQNAQPEGTWIAGDLYSDIWLQEIAPRQVILDVAASLDFKTWSLQLSQLATITPIAANDASQFTRTRNTSDNSRRVSEMELIWQPPLSIFDYEGALPCGKYELSMLPFNVSQMKLNAIESIGVASKSVDDFVFEVEEIYLYIEELEGENCTDMKYLLDLSQLRMQENVFTTSGFAQRSFDVSPATNALTIAYQDGRVNSDTRVSASKFKIYPAAIPPDAATNIISDYGLSMNRQYFSYSGHNYPPQDAETKFDATTDRTTQRYVESLMQSNAYSDTGGNETIAEFHSAGSYYHQKIYKDRSDGATRAVVYSGFSGVDNANARVLVFDTHTIVAEVTISNGSIKNVSVAEM